jgi:hypothetical protein
LAGDTLADHLTFALRHEDLDLLVLKRIFEAAPVAEIAAFTRAAPTGIPARRAWYLYETLTDRTLPLDDAPRVQAILLLDPKAYFTGKPLLSRRHRVRDNLLGTGRFCPIIRRTRRLTEFLGADLAARAPEIVSRTGPISWLAPPASCCSPTAGPVSRSRVNARHATGSSAGAAP